VCFRANALSARIVRASGIIGRVDTVATQFASRLGLIAFATAALRGLFCGSDFFGTLQTALIGLGTFYVLGLVMGEAARRIVEENVKGELLQRLGSATGKELPASAG
jgi:hypothetical protein